jgi:hypothetical protein
MSCYAKIKDEQKISELLDYVYSLSTKLATKKSIKTDVQSKDIFEPQQAIKILTGAGFTGELQR